MYDIAIIGAGIIGTAIARELSSYDLSLVVIEKESDVANGTTKANSAIVHAGYDPEPGTLKALLNASGAGMYASLCRDLNVPFKQIGSLVVAFDDSELDRLETLLQRGLDFNVPGIKLLDKARLSAMEPNLNPKAKAALYAPNAGIIDPCLTTIALAESAVVNGAELKLNHEVERIEKNEAAFKIFFQNKTNLEARLIINAAGLYADKIDSLINSSSFIITPYRGEYFLLDKGTGDIANHVIFPTPSDKGKGVLVTPTIHGNLITGPNSEFADSKTSTQTTAEGLDYIRENALKLVPCLPFDKVITTFSGLRAKTNSGDFIIEESSQSAGFFNVAAIDSPGLAAAPAIARHVVSMVLPGVGYPKKKKVFHKKVHSKSPFFELGENEKTQLIKDNPKYGQVICRCEGITEGEIVNAIHSPVGAKTLDGIKKRCRPGSGRCQGGFCGPKVMQILARELDVNLESVEKNNRGSYLLTGPTRNSSNISCPETVYSGDNIVTTSEDNKEFYQLIVVGGGPAGMAAASAAYDNGARDILIIERDFELGGILQQCIHNGFGLHHFRQELTGPEYAELFIKLIEEKGICCKMNSMVLSIDQDKTVTYINSREGLKKVKCKAIVLAMGCRERTRGAINIPGMRPAGIYSAGTAQRLVNIDGYLVGKKVVVFGSGDIGLIMARRMVLEGAEVIAVIERKDYSDGLVRNQVQCLQDFNIPLLLQHTIVNIRGMERVEGVTIARTDAKKRPLSGTYRDLDCDTILFSRGLIPENELTINAGIDLDNATGGPLVVSSMETSSKGIFACGNVVHVHDLVDWVTEESIRAGKSAALYISNDSKTHEGYATIDALDGIKYVIPHRIVLPFTDNSLHLLMRVKDLHEKAIIAIKADQVLIKEVRKKALTPGEMIEIKLNRKELPENSFKNITVEIVAKGVE